MPAAETEEEKWSPRILAKNKTKLTGGCFGAGAAAAAGKKLAVIVWLWLGY